MPTTTALPELVDKIMGTATEDDLTQIEQAVGLRRRALRQVRAAAVTVGATVTITEISPKYLTGLSGTITTIDKGRHASVRLDEESTTTLRFTRQRRFFVRPDVTEYTITGIPLSCCVVRDG